MPPSKGVLQTGWQTIDGAKYYFGKDGVRQTGVIKAGTKLYYQTKDGIVTGDGKTAMKLDEKYYVMNEKGVLKTGWLTVGDAKYYFDKTNGGALIGWQQISGRWYEFDEEGKVA